MTDEPQAPQSALFGDADLPAVEAPRPPYLTIYVHFERPEDVEAFGKLIGFPASMKTRVLPWPLDDLFADRGPGALAAMKPEDAE